MVSAILLAAGESKRMGKQDKLFLKYNGNWIINLAIQTLWASNKSELIIVMNNDENNLLKGQNLDEIRVVLNPEFRKGMTTSIKVGVRNASAESHGYMICLADQPLMKKEDYNEIINRFDLLYKHDPQCIVVPFFGGEKGNPVVFSNAYKDTLLCHEDMEGCRGIVEANKEHVYQMVMNNNHILKDIDTPEDYQELVS